MLAPNLATILTTALTIGLAFIAQLAIRRVFLSPLAHIPGPRLAALTHWYEFYYDVVKPGQFVFKIKDLHSIYDEIYPTSNSRKREKDSFQLRNLGLPYATAGAQGHELHRRRREALNPFFSQQSVFALFPLINSKVQQLCAHLDTAIQKPGGQVVNLYDLYYALARDVVFEYSFDKKCNMLASIQEAAVMRRNLTSMLLTVKLRANLPLLFQAIQYLPASVGAYFTPPGAKHMANLRKDIGVEIQQIMTEKAQGHRTEKRSILYDLREHDELQKPEELPIRLGQEGTFLVMAATESTAKTLGICHFYLLQNPSIMARLRDELFSTRVTSLSELSRLPYLNAVIAEGNRLAFGLTGRVARVAPEETLRYKEYGIPPGTPLSMTTLCIHTDPDVFPDPWRFDPDRWLGEEGKHRLKYHYGFGKGARRCLGLNLANAELLLCLSAVVRYDMELYETTEEDVRFQHDFQVAHPKLDSKGIRAVVRGKLSESH
ncbi:MAG: hypothetical protein Q9162_001904 [Coniocarpon cinnabarinum]